MLAHLRVIANPTDAVSWLRVLTLVKGVGNRTAERLIEMLIVSPEPEKALIASSAVSIARGERPEAFRRLAELLAEMRGDAKRPAEQVAATVSYYMPLMRDLSDDYPKRERDLEHFQNLTERYRSLQQMLSDMALEPPNDSLGGVLATDAEDEYLTLSTIHSAKGTRVEGGVPDLGG